MARIFPDTDISTFFIAGAPYRIIPLRAPSHNIGLVSRSNSGSKRDILMRKAARRKTI
jgi:hypothetical protein